VVRRRQRVDVRASLNDAGRLLLQWRTGADRAGSCRSLVVRFGLDGWSDADAVFTLHFRVTIV
jgi:hypothetical protein